MISQTAALSASCLVPWICVHPCGWSDPKHWLSLVWVMPHSHRLCKELKDRCVLMTDLTSEDIFFYISNHKSLASWAMEPHSPETFFCYWCIYRALHLPWLLQLQMSFGFPDFISTCASNVFALLSSSWSQFPSSVCFLFVSEVTQELCVHLLWPSATVAQPSEHCSCALRRLSLKISQLWAFALQGIFPQILPSRLLKSSHLKSKAVILFFVLHTPLRIWNSTVLCSLQPRLSCPWLSSRSFSLFVSSCSSLRGSGST